MISERRREPPPERHRHSFENVLRCGYALPVGEEIQAVRAAYGLEPVDLVPPERVRQLLESS
jgi:hypothetical protein